MSEGGFTVPEVIQLFGVIVSLLVILNRILTVVRDWRKGSPELRLIREQLAATNESILDLLRRVLRQLEVR